MGDYKLIFESMLTLYYKPTCAFCRRVIAVIDRLELEVEMKNVVEADLKAEMEELGGRSQTPFLVDTDKDIKMYESDDIVNYLQTNYGKSVSVPVRPRVHISDNACVSCEG
ncbi:MAG: glutaredoxin 2 [Parcubacteria bacterium OLB19]|nr:MAG: glutaredoxin 2 [Parcubacteria bacterium OLB19]